VRTEVDAYFLYTHKRGVKASERDMREGELLGLKWEDVDLDSGVLRLRHGLVREGGKTVLGDLKPPKSRRSVRLTRAATEALRSYLKRQLEEMERMGSLYQPGGLVFATQTGTLINPSNLRNSSFKPLLKRRAARHLLSRPPAHLRYLAALTRHSSEAGSGASGARNHSHDSGYLLSLPAEHGRPDREGYGSSSHLEHLRCCTVAAQRAPELPEPFLVSRALPAKQRFFRVGDAGFESATSSL
jgi:hypothetical protein